MDVSSWISPKTQKGLPSPISGLGFFAVQDIAAGEIVAAKGGHVMDTATLKKHWEVTQHAYLQIADDLHIAPLTPEEIPQSFIYFNHSCDPSMGIDGQMTFVTLRDVVAGEELTVDYATLFCDEYHLECQCGAKTCRGAITGEDWKNQALQAKYGSHFAWFILQKILAS